MQPRSLEQRVTALEGQTLQLRELRGQVTTLESQILQLRQETRDEVSSIRREHKAADDDTRAFMRILYEDVLARIESLGEVDGFER